MRETTTRQHLAGVLILLGLLAQIIGFTGAVPTAQAVSYLLWAAVALLWRDIPKRSRIQAGVLIALGVVMLVVATEQHRAPAATSICIYPSRQRAIVIIGGIQFDREILI